MMMFRSLRITALVSLLALALPAGAESVAAPDLYKSQTIVTGRRDETRQPGFARCLDDVLLKLSGDQRILEEPELETLRGRAGEMIASYGYHDRMEGIPVHDEQGTHDRPYDLFCDFDHAAIDEALRSLDARPWSGTRPSLAVLIAVESGTSFVLTSDGDGGRFMREALTEEAGRLALPVGLPSTALAGKSGLDPALPKSAPLPALEKIAVAMGADDVLAGSLVWSDRELGWIANWRLDHNGTVHQWRIHGVNFDAAFRNALRGAAQVLSGSGEP